MIAMQTLVEVSGVSVSFGAVAVLSDVSLCLRRGEIVTLIGLNGAGKSTLVRAILGLVKPDVGHIVREKGIRIGYSPQVIQQDPSFPLTVNCFLRMAKPDRQLSIIEILTEVGAAHTLKRQMATLSGGEFHRVLLARALLRKPDLLVLDEPLAGVDVTGQAELYQLIASIRDRYHCGILLVSHDLHLVMAATDHVICLNKHVCCTGHPHAVAKDPEFVNLFGQHAADVLAVYTHHHDHHHDIKGGAVPLKQSETVRHVNYNHGDL